MANLDVKRASCVGCGNVQERLASRGGRATVSEWEVVRKTRYSKKTWPFARLAER